MRKLLHHSSVLVLIGGLALSLSVFGFFETGAVKASDGTLGKVKALNGPTVTLKHWRDSASQEKLAFLFGFVSLVEMEKEWQGNPPLPIKQSTIGSWVKGLDGVSLQSMSDALDIYAEQHGDADGLSVFEALGEIYVRPKMSAKDLETARKHAAQIRSRALAE